MGLQLVGMGGEGHEIGGREGGRRIQVSRRGREEKGSILNTSTSSSIRSDGRNVFTLWRATKIIIFIFALCKGQKWSYNYYIERVHVFAIMQGHFHVLPHLMHTPFSSYTTEEKYSLPLLVPSTQSFTKAGCPHPFHFRV